MASEGWRSSVSSRWSRLINCPAASRSCSIFLSSAAVAVSGAILTIAVVSAVAACSPPAPMKHFVNESSDMGFFLEVAPARGLAQEYGASLDLQQLYALRMNCRFVESRASGTVRILHTPHRSLVLRRIQMIQL